jgi:hypothetical protein
MEGMGDGRPRQMKISRLPRNVARLMNACLFNIAHFCTIGYILGSGLGLRDFPHKRVKMLAAPTTLGPVAADSLNLLADVSALLPRCRGRLCSILT